MDKTLFEYNDYKSYLLGRTGARNTKKGVKTALARTIGCQPTYLSQVLHSHAHLSLEQAEKVNDFFAHGKEESAFFLLLVMKNRAGTASLTKHFQAQLEEILKRRMVLTKRLGEKKTLSAEVQAVYYSSWIYSAAHIALTIPALRTREALSQFLQVPLPKITATLEFLVGARLARPEGSKFLPGEAHVRLGNDSHNIVKHHSNWRTQALDALDREQLADLHYSGVVSLSKADVVKIKGILLDAISASQKIVAESKEEELVAVAVDLFSLRKGVE